MKVINVPVNCSGGPGDSVTPYATIFLCNIIRNIIRYSIKNIIRWRELVFELRKRK